MSPTTTAKPSKGTNEATVTTPSDREVHIERTFDAPPDRVWRAMTDEKLLAQWWGRGNKLDIERYDLRRGGHWRFVEHADGQTHGFEGRFAEVTPRTRLVQTFEWDGAPGHVTLQTQTLVALPDGRTKLVIHCLFLTTEDRDDMLSKGMEAGLNASHAALDAVLAKL